MAVIQNFFVGLGTVNIAHRKTIIGSTSDITEALTTLFKMMMK